MSHRRRSPVARHAGFTLLELIVVFAIISLLATVTLAAANAWRERARTASTLEEVTAFQQAASIYYSSAGRYPVPLNPEDACTNGDHVTPNVCCVSQGGCDYGGTSLATASFAEGSFLGDVMPAAPRAPVAADAGGVDYRGVFYYCSSSSCHDATVAWTQSAGACGKGTTHTGGDDGVCEQSVTLSGN